MPGRCGERRPCEQAGAERRDDEGHPASEDGVPRRRRKKRGTHARWRGCLGVHRVISADRYQLFEPWQAVQVVAAAVRFTVPFAWVAALVVLML